jgi:hypothetical protein
MRGADIHVVALQLGHKDLRQAARYQHLVPTFLQDDVRGLDGVFGPELAQIAAPALLETTEDRYGRLSPPQHRTGDSMVKRRLSGMLPHSCRLRSPPI